MLQNNTMGDTVSFTGRGSRATNIVFALLASIAALTSVSNAKAANMPDKNTPVPTPTVVDGCIRNVTVLPPVPTAVPSTSADNSKPSKVPSNNTSVAPSLTPQPPVSKTPQIPLGPGDLTEYGWRRLQMEEAEAAALEAREAADKADTNAKDLEAKAQSAKKIADIYDNLKPQRDIVYDGFDAAASTDRYIEMTDKSVPEFEGYVEYIENAVKEGKISVENVEDVKASIANTRAKIADIHAAVEGANGAATGVRESARETSKLVNNVVEAAKGGVWLPNEKNIKVSSAKTAEATKNADTKLGAMKAAYEAMYASVRELSITAREANRPAPRAGVVNPPPIVDTIEMIYGKSKERMEAECLTGEAAMARMSADDLAEKAEILEQKAEAYSKILEAVIGKNDAEKAETKVENLENEVEIAKTAAVDSLDAVPARLAGRDAIDHDLAPVNNEVSNLNYINWRAEGVLLSAEKAGVDKETINTVLDAVAHAEDVIKDTKAAASLLREAANNAKNAKNKEEAKAAIVVLDEAKAVAKEAAETAKAEAKELASAINKLILTIEKTTGKASNLSPVASSSKPVTSPSVIACGLWEIYGKTPEQMALSRLESKLEAAKAEATAAQEKLEKLEADAARARALLIALDAEEAARAEE